MTLSHGVCNDFAGQVKWNIDKSKVQSNDVTLVRQLCLHSVSVCRSGEECSESRAGYETNTEIWLWGGFPFGLLTVSSA
jgi:hypothetical protein